MKRLAILALIFSGVAWGLGFPLGKLAMREMEAAHMVLLRFGVAAVAALPFALARAEARALFKSPVVLVAGLLYGLAFLIQFEGLARVNVSLAALLVGAMPALIAICAPLFGEKVGKLSWIGVAAATLGAVLIAGKPGDAGSMLGIIVSLIALLIFMLWLVALKRAPKSPTGMALPSVIVVLAAVTLLPITLVLHGPPPLDVSPAAWVGIIGQGLLSTLLATAAWQFALARVGSATAGVFVNIEPLMGAGIGVLLFGDALTWAIVAGGLMILAGSFVVVLGEKSAPPDDLAHSPVTPA